MLGGARAETSVITFTPRSQGSSWSDSVDGGVMLVPGDSVRRQGDKAGIPEGRLLGLRASWSPRGPGPGAASSLPAAGSSLGAHVISLLRTQGLEGFAPCLCLSHLWCVLAQGLGPVGVCLSGGFHSSGRCHRPGRLEKDGTFGRGPSLRPGVEVGPACAARRTLPAMIDRGSLRVVPCLAGRLGLGAAPRARRERGPQEEPRLLVRKGLQRPGAQTPCGPHT